MMSLYRETIIYIFHISNFKHSPNSGEITTYIEMIQDGFISIKEATIRLDITEDELKNILDNSK